MPKKKAPTEDPKQQFKRFAEAAREAGIDPATTEREFKKLAGRRSALKPLTRSKKD